MSQTWVYRPKYGQALTARRAGAGGLGTGADGHRDSECTWVECDSGVVEPHSVTSLAVSYVLRVMDVGWGVDRRGQKSEVNPCFPAPYKHYGIYTM
jgi:hypothetical protein